MLRNGRAVLLAAAASLGLHGALVLWLWRLPPVARPQDSAAFALSFTALVPGASASGESTGHRPVDREPLRFGGPRASQNIDTLHRGGRGDAIGSASTVLLLDRVSGITLQDSPLDNLAARQTQRIRTASDRASWEDRRATPNPDDQPFLASGKGSHPERRPVSASDAEPGARMAPTASRDGTSASSRAHEVLPAAAGTSEAVARQAGRNGTEGDETPSPGRGIPDGRGPRSSAAANVAFARPPVDQGPAATPATRQGRVRDDEDAELLASSMLQSFVEASSRHGRETGEGLGGPGGGGPAGNGQGDQPGGRASTYMPGPGRYAALDTNDARYIRWYIEQRRRVERALVFPHARELAMDEGTSVYRLVVRRDGTLADSPQLLRSSGFADLDQAALDAIRSSTPFGPLPPELAPADEAIRVTLGVQFENPMVH